MLRNYFKAAIRNLLRQKSYSLLNLLGLSVGITCCLLLTLHIKQELSYEKSFSKHRLIYRVVSTESSKSHPPEAAEMMKFFPAIKSAVRFANPGTPVVNTEDGNRGEFRGLFSDSTAPELFDFKNVLGDPARALSEPFSAVITRSMSEKLFGKKDPIGQRLIFVNRDTIWVRAVIEDLPANTHLTFDYLLSMATTYRFTPENMLASRNWMFGWTYLLFNTEEDAAATAKRLPDFWKKYWESEPDKKVVAEEGAKLRLQPITDIHLRSDLIQEMGPNGSIAYLYIFMAVGLLILLIACINFVNLFTTQALKRLKEVAVRKVLGARKWQLTLQFLGEAFILTILAGFLAILFYQLSLPLYNSITGKQVSRMEVLLPANLLIVAGIVLFTGALSGLFPALFIAGFEPVDSLKGQKIPRSPANTLRKGLVTFQFVAASFLIISTVIVYQQMKIFRDRQLGFDKEQVMVVKLYGNFKDKIVKHSQTIANEILSNPDFLAVGKCSDLIGDDLSVESVIPVQAADAKKDYSSVRVTRVDENYLTVMGISLKEGRNFSLAFNDSSNFIINEKAAEVLGLKAPVGSLIVNTTYGERKGRVVGVVRDFHFASLRSRIEPLVLEYYPEAASSLLVKIRPGKAGAAIAYMRKKVEEINPGTLFSYGFLDDRIAGLYKKEDDMSSLLKIFTVLSVAISCLGLFGLAAHAAEIRTREIGIRKVIGASIPSLVRLLSGEFAGLVLVGNLVAWPFAWWAMHVWEQGFVYRAEIRWEVFLASAALTLGVAAATAGLRCIRAARANPIKSLRTD